MRKQFAAAWIVAGALITQPAVAIEFTMPVRSIDEVADGAMPTVVDITANEAILRFDSSIPLVCSVVYGETPNFGSVATDLDMNGGAHTDHRPIMTGLQPDTEYFWRVQGTSADGTVYIGEMLTFRTPPQVASLRPNLVALERGAEVRAVSSNFGDAANDGAWGANSAIDGSRSTAWSSSGDGDDAYIEIAMTAPQAIDEIEVWTRSMSDGTAQIFSFVVTTDRGETFGPFELPDASQPYRFPLNATAQSLRLKVVDSSGGNVGLVEFGAYGTTPTQ